MSNIAAPIQPPVAGARVRGGGLPAAQFVLAALIVAEVVIFSLLATNFLTPGNFFQLSRHNVELGLLALAMTPVIVTGGIDLSVGSLMGLSAVLFGKLWRDAGLPPWAAAGIAIALAGLAGALNGLLVTKLRIPALIVTLGTFSLFRGMAEGITRGVDKFWNFPASFTFLGNGSVGPMPVQLLILGVAAVAFWALLQRSIIGRAFSAIGYSAEGARYAGIPVERRVALAYVLSGLCAGIAAVIYVARVDQATADVGLGYELLAITAVVLGGTSIFGGRGTIVGTLLGLLAIALLQNGLTLADMPRELAGILTGLLLVVATGLDFRPAARQARAATAARVAAGDGAAGGGDFSEEFEMRNSQLTALSAVILLAALIIAGSNYFMLKGVSGELSRRGNAVTGAEPGTPGSGKPVKPGKRLTVAVMPKSKGNSYFVACRRGAEEAAKELDVDLLWDGPTDPDPAKQNEIIDTWVTRGVDVIAVAVENQQGISTALRAARKKGIEIVTFDSDAEPDARAFFVNQATTEGIAHTLMDTAAGVMGGKGDFAIITASLTASNMNAWRAEIERHMAAKYPEIKLVTVRPSDDIQAKAFEETNTILGANPNVKLIMAICSPAVPGAAEAVKQSGRQDVKVIGLGLPNQNKQYVHADITKAVVLWNTMDLGYLAVRAAHDVKTGALKAGAKSIDAGRLGQIPVEGDSIVLGKPVVFTKENIDKYDF